MEIINIITTENNIVSDIKSYAVVCEENKNDVVEQVENDFTEIVKNFNLPKTLSETEISEYVEDGFSCKGVDVAIVYSYSYNE